MNILKVRILVLIFLSQVFAPALLAQTAGSNRADLVIQPYGIVDVNTLPPPGPSDQDGEAIPFLTPDDELFRQKKREMRPDDTEIQRSLRFERQPVVPLGATAGFDGLRYSESGRYLPPDTQVAAGPSDVIFEVVNVRGRRFTKRGTILNSFDLRDFFEVPRSVTLVDPKIRFDPRSRRWFVAAVTIQGTNGSWRLAVSVSSNPAVFRLYGFVTPGSFPDFPAIGINDDKVVLTANAYQLPLPPPGEQAVFLGAEFLVLNKAHLLAGTPAAFRFYGPQPGLWTIQPAHSLSSTPTLFMAAVDFPYAESIRVWSVTGVPGVGEGVQATSVELPINPHDTPPDAVQRGSSVLLVTNANGLLDAVFRDGSLWVTANTACVPKGDKNTRACLRLIRVLTEDMFVYEDFDFGTPGTYYFYPAIQTDSENNLVVVFSRSSVAEYASVYASRRAAEAFPDTLAPPVLIKAGEAAYEPGGAAVCEPLAYCPRWGDYSGAAIDPADQTIVWVAGEYARREGGDEWGTWIAPIPTGVTSVAYVAKRSDNTVSAYSISPTTGALMAIPGSPFPAGLSPTSVTVDPTGQFVYVANGVQDGRVSAFAINPATAALTRVFGSPFVAGRDPRSVAVDTTGQFAYVANGGSGNVSAYTINAATGALTPVPGSPFPAGLTPTSVTVDPTGQFVYVANGVQDGRVSAFAINPATGALTRVFGSPFVAGAYPRSVTVDPTGQFVYVANSGSNNVSAYTIGADTGALTPVPGSPFPAGSWPTSVAVDPTGQFAYVANVTSHNVSAYLISASSGTLTPVPGSPFWAGSSPSSVAVDPTGQFAYVANLGSDNVSAYTIDATTGALTPVPGSPFPARGSPFSVTTTLLPRAKQPPN